MKDNVFWIIQNTQTHAHGLALTWTREPSEIAKRCPYLSVYSNYIYRTQISISYSNANGAENERAAVDLPRVRRPISYMYHRYHANIYVICIAHTGLGCQWRNFFVRTSLSGLGDHLAVFLCLSRCPKHPRSSIFDKIIKFDPSCQIRQLNQLQRGPGDCLRSN